jgi:dipeptidyl aminopeptidase/acylaminoacyl peptidase
MSLRSVLHQVAALLLASACATTPPAAPESLAPVVAAAPPPGVNHAPRPPVALAEYLKTRRIGSRSGILLSFSHDEQQVAFLSDEGGRTDIWVQPTAGGPAAQITHVSGFIQSFAFSPTEDRLTYETDVGGDELPHLFITDGKGTAPRDLTGDYPPGARTDFLEWADDGKTFLFLSSQRDPKYLDLCEYDVGKGRAQRLWESSGVIAFALTSHDHRHFIVAETLSDSNSNLYLVERGSKAKPVLLTPHTGDVLYAPQVFARDGRTLYFTSDQAGEFQSLYTMDLKTRTQAPLAEPTWDVEGADFTHAGKYFYVVTNVDGLLQFALADAKTHAAVALPEPPPGGAWVPITSSKSDRYLGVRMQGDGAPAAPYVIDLEQHSARKMIEPLPPSLAGHKMAVGEVVRIPSFDGRPVPAFLYKPEGAGPFPAVIDVHGGPTAQSRREFSAIRQYLVSKGYVVLVPNVRGSTGYGKSYTRLDNHDLGGGPLQDVVACKGWMVEHANVDPKRVVVSGGSYGGYMALAAATFTPHEFAALVDYFGVSDLKSLVESFPAYWATGAPSIYVKFGNPQDPADAKYQHDRSPINFVDRIDRPLLVVQGERDARVKQDQSERVVAALRERKVPVHYLILPGEGHGFSKSEAVLAAYQATDRFLDRYLFGDSTVQVLPGEK